MLELVSSFKERFAQALSIRNIKAIELSEKTGISESTISQYKGGYSKPKDKRLVMIADALDVSPQWLMGLNVPMENTQKIIDYWANRDSDIEDSPLSEEQKMFIELFENATQEGKKAAVLVLKSQQQKP